MSKKPNAMQYSAHSIQAHQNTETVTKMENQPQQKQADMVPVVPRSQKKKGTMGTQFVWNPAGSQYPDFKTGAIKTRDRQTLQIAQVGIPNKIEINTDTIADLKELFSSQWFRILENQIEKPDRLSPASENPT